MLLGRNADVNVRNGEGRTARDVGVEDGDTKRLLEAAEKTDSRRKEEALLSAARIGDLAQISDLVNVVIMLQRHCRQFVEIEECTLRRRCTFTPS